MYDSVFDEAATEMVGGWDEKEHNGRTGTGLQDNRAAWRRKRCVESGSLTTTDEASARHREEVSTCGRAGLKFCDREDIGPCWMSTSRPELVGSSVGRMMLKKVQMDRRLNVKY